MNHLTTTVYHLQTNEQAKTFTKTIVVRLRHYVAEHMRDWDIYVQPLTYVYKTKAHSSRDLTPFSLVL